MRHLALFRFEPGYFGPEAVKRTEQVFQQLKQELPDDLLGYQIFTHCVERDTNADICIDIHLKGPESLPVYLPHPIHQALVAEWIPHVVNRITFDC